MDDDDEDEVVDEFKFQMALEVNHKDNTLDIEFLGIPREHVQHMFSTAVADVVTTSLMELELKQLEEDDEEPE